MTDSMIPPPPPKPDEPGVFEDLVDVFIAPVKVFARRAKGGGGAAFFLIAIALAAVLYTGKGVMEPIMDAQFDKSRETMMKNNPNITAEQLDSMRSTTKKFGTFILVVGAPLALFFLGLFLWIVGKIFGAAITFGTAMVFSSLAYAPRIIGGVITDVQGLMMSDTSVLRDPAQLSFGPARFLDAATTSPVLLALATRLDLITIWVTVLIGVAYYAGGKLTKGKAAAAAITLWILGGFFPLLGAMRQ